MILRTDTQLSDAIRSRRLVNVYINGELDSFGIITDFTDDTITIYNEDHFIRDNVEIRIEKKKTRI